MKKNVMEILKFCGSKEVLDRNSKNRNDDNKSRNCNIKEAKVKMNNDTEKVEA